MLKNKTEVSKDYVKKIVPKEYASFMRSFRGQTTLTTFAETENGGDFFQLFNNQCGCGMMEDSEGQEKRLDKIYDCRDNLYKEFKKKTGLRLGLGFKGAHQDEEGYGTGPGRAYFYTKKKIKAKK